MRKNTRTKCREHATCIVHTCNTCTVDITKSSVFTMLAVMETVMKHSPATFIIIINLNNPNTEIMQQLSYWLNFIDDATCRTTAKSCLIIVGSHADLKLLPREIVNEKLKIVSDLVQKVAERQILEFFGVISMDCRKVDSGSTRKFTSLLSKSQKSLSSRAPSMSFICHFMYAVLQWRRKCAGTIAWKLQDSATFLDEQHSSRILPSEIPLLNDLLLSLNSKGVIIYLQNHKKLAESWIIVDTEALLNKIKSTNVLMPRWSCRGRVHTECSTIHDCWQLLTCMQVTVAFK